MREEAENIEQAEEHFSKNSTGIWCVDAYGEEKFCNTLAEAQEFFLKK